MTPEPTSGHFLYALLFTLDSFFGKERVNGLLARARRRWQGARLRQLKEYGKGRLTSPLEATVPQHMHLAKGVPIVYRGAAKNWPCMSKWSFDFFAENYADEEEVLIGNPGLGGREEASTFRTVLLGDYLRGLRRGSRDYLKFSPLLNRNPELHADLAMDWLRSFSGKLARREEIQIFFGNQGSYTPMHAAMECNVFVQVCGQKRWRLYSADRYPMIDPVPARYSYYYSDVDPDNVNLETHPLFPYVNGYEVVLNPGDVLWNPPYVWHEVSNLTDSIGIGFRFNSMRLALKASMLLTIMRFFCSDPNILQTLYYSARGKNFLHVPKS